MGMRLGFVSAILGECAFEEVVGFAAEGGFECVELMCWPVGKAERRYAGVTHIDMDGLTPERESQIKGCLREKGVAISALGYYPNLLDPDPERRAFFAGHLAKVVDAASRLGVGLVNTFVGRNKSLGLEENFAVFREVWPPIVRHAEGRGVRIGIENCPMLFSGDEWPGGNNMAVSPAVWRRMFEMIPSPSFGLNYDPSHLVWQRMDHIKPISEFRDRLFHVHIKDVRVYRDRLDDHGILAAPLAYHSPKLPGLGDINWDGFLSALTDVRYGGDVCIEVEDKAFEDTLEDRKRALMISKRVWRF